MYKVVHYLSFLIFFGFLSSCNNQKTISYTSIDLEHIDTTISPDENFYLFANGKWLEQTTIPSTLPLYKRTHDIYLKQDKILENILDSLIKLDLDKSNKNKVLADFYISAIDKDTRNELGISPIGRIIDDFDNIKTKSDLATEISKLHNTGSYFMFHFFVNPDKRNPRKHAYYMNQQGVTLPSYFYKSSDYEVQLNRYQKHLKQSFKLLNYDSLGAEIAAKSVINLEKQILEGLKSKEELRNVNETYNKKSNHEVAEMFANFDWHKYQNLRGIEDLDSVIIDNPKFLIHVDKLIGSISLNTWKNYLKWRLFYNWSSFLDEKSSDHQFEFFKKYLLGQNEQKSIKKQTISLLTKLPVSQLLGEEYVRRYFSKESKQEVNEMIDNIIEAFKFRIENLEWMSQKTKNQSLKKLSKISRNIGYPKSYDDFSNLKINRHEFVNNLMNIFIYRTKKNLDKINEPNDRGMSFIPHVINAFYSPVNNSIMFPAGILQKPIFHENYELAVNYGRLGTIIGHELTHGFDDQGSKYALNGALKNWWQNNDKIEFEKRCQLLGETFSKFCPIENKCVNSKLTMGENIADLGGLIIAYKAYQMTDEYKSNKLRFGFTPSQRFFIAYAQLFATKYTDNSLKKTLNLDPHAPSMYRVNGSLKNCPDFFDVFSIPENSKMRNPKGKISVIW